MIYNLLLVLEFFIFVEAHFRNGKTLFTETVTGRCDQTSSGGYIFDYNDLGGADLDTVSQIGIAFWMRYRPTNPSVATWDSNARQYAQVFYITDNVDSLKYRILSLAVILQGSYDTFQVYQQENPYIDGPNIDKSMGGEQKEMIDDRWMFIWLGFDFYDTSYNIKFFTEDSYEPFDEIKESCSKVFSINGCEAGILPRPYLRRPNMKLYVASHAPSDGLGQQGYNFCGDIAGFQWYPGVYNIDPSNLNVLRYGFNVYGRYLNYRMDSFPFGSLVHDFSKERQHATFTAGTENYQWNEIERALKVTGPTQIKLPQIAFNEQRDPIFNSLGRFSMALWLKATPNIPIFSLLKRINGISDILALRIEWEASSSTYLINYIQTTSFKISARIQPDVWNHLMIVFQYYHFSLTQLIVDTQALIIYLNDNAPLQVQATGVLTFKRIVEEDLIYIGNMENIPSGGSIYIANYQFHQGGRIIYHNEVDDYESSCMYSFLLNDKRLACWRCQSGFALYEHIDGSTDCILPENCNDNTEIQMNSHDQRRSCYHECAANCKTCNPLSPGVCTSCINNLLLGVSGTCTCDGVDGYIGDGINMECLSSTRLNSFTSGSYALTTLGDVMSGTGLRKTTNMIKFPSPLAGTPSILLSIAQISLNLGNSFYIYSSSPNVNSFLLTIQAMGTTTISSIEVQYFASSDTGNFQISTIQLSTQSALNDDTTTGFRTQSNIIPFGSWDMRYGSPTMVPFLVGWDQLSGSDNFTLQYNITYFANSLEFQTITDGNSKIGNVYWNYIFIPKYLEHFSIINNINKLNQGPLSVSFDPQSGDIRWNQTVFEFTEEQNKASQHMFGMSQVGFRQSTYLKISIYEIKSENQSKLRYSPIDTTLLSSFGAELFTTQANCQSMACRTCGFSPQDCVSCMNVAKDIQQQCLNCASDQYIEYTTFTCESCAQFCVGCQGARDSCLACPTLANRQDNILNKCSCIDIRYFDDGTAICALCDQRCAACKDTSTGCTDCLGSNRNTLMQCDCKPGFYDDTVHDDCKPCLQPCENCNLDGCLTCLGNKVISTVFCVCPVSGIPIEGTQICDTCSDVPVVITVASTLDKVIINFFAGTYVQYASVALDLMGDKERCNFIFSQKTLGLFGTIPSCFLDASGSSIEVLLGNEPTVLKDDSIIILNRIFKKKTCLEELILNYYFTTVVNPISFDSPTFKVSTPEFGVGICEMFNVSIVDIKNHGYRTPKSIKWALDMELLDTTLKEKIQGLISAATTKNQLYVIFNKNYLPPYSLFYFTATYENYLLSSTTVKFTVKTLGAVQIYLNVLTKTQIEHSFKHELIIPTNSYYTRCVNGVQNTFYDSLQVTWSEMERDPPDSLPYINVPVVANTPPTDNYLRIPNNTGSYDTTYLLQADLLFIDKNLQNEDIEIRVSKQVSVKVFDMNIGIGTVGGNRMVAVDAEFTIEAFAYDPFDTVIQEQSDPSIELTWVCITASGKLCFNEQGKELELLQNQPIQTILANSLLNGQSYNFSIQAKRGIRQALYFTIVTVLDYEIKPLKIDYPLTIHSQIININQELVFQILQNINEYQFYFSIIYKNVPLNTVKLQVPIMRIKLIDYLPKVIDDDQLIIKILAQSNDQVEALQSIIPLTFNIPPSKAQFTISPTSGIAMDTLFNITINKAYDTDLPLEYRLLLYPSKQHYELDILNGLPINGYPFTAYQISPEFNFLSLPSSRMPNSTTESTCLLVVQVRDAHQGTNNFSISIVATRNHRLFLNYIVTLSTLRDKLMAFATPQHIIGASFEAIYFLQASINMKSIISKDLLEIINEQYQRLEETVMDVTIDPSLIESMKKIMQLYDSFNYKLQMNILNAISVAETTVAFEQVIANLDKEITGIQTLIPILFVGLRKDMEMGDQNVQGDLYRTYWQINNIFNSMDSILKILPAYEQIIELQTKFAATESYQSILMKDQGEEGEEEEEEAYQGEEEQSEEQSSESEEAAASEEQAAASEEQAAQDDSQQVEVSNKFLEKYQGIQVYLSLDTIEKVLTDKNVDRTLLTEMDKNIQFLHTLPESISDAQLDLLTINDGQMFFNGSIIEITVQKVTAQKLLEILVEDLQNINAINVLQTTNITNDNITTDKTGVRMLQQNISGSYSVTIVTYKFNPHLCSQNFINSTGPAAFDLTFPVYKPIIKDPEGIQIDKIPGYNISFQFVIPPAKYGAIKFLQCAQLVTQWSANNSMCLRSLEYSKEEQQFRIWCNCPSISDTALIIPYVYVPPAIIVKVEEKTGPPEFGVDTFFTFQFGIILGGMTGFFLLCMGTGAGFDAKRQMTQRIEQEEKERLIAEIRETTRVHRKVRQMQDDLEEEIGEDAEEHNRLVPNNIVNFQNASKKVMTIDAFTQTAKLDIKGNADMGLADFNIILYLSALIEVFSILLFFDPIAQRPVRFLSLYLKFIVMLLLSGFFFQENSLLISLAITTGLAEVSSVILKVTRSQLAANSGFQVMMGVLLTLAILIVAIQQILVKAFGQQAEVLDKWVAFYEICLVANIFCVEPFLIYFKLIFYPWCLKQTLLGYTTPMIYLLLFLVQQEDLKSFMRI